MGVLIGHWVTANTGAAALSFRYDIKHWKRNSSVLWGVCPPVVGTEPSQTCARICYLACQERMEARPKSLTRAVVAQTSTVGETDSFFMRGARIQVQVVSTMMTVTHHPRVFFFKLLTQTLLVFLNLLLAQANRNGWCCTTGFKEDAVLKWKRWLFFSAQPVFIVILKGRLSQVIFLHGFSMFLLRSRHPHWILWWTGMNCCSSQPCYTF